jgi:ribosome-associated protein
MDITDTLHIPEDELRFTFARSGGPGGQNVNKVSSKAILHWDFAGNRTLPEDVKDRLRRHNVKRLTTEGLLVIQGQRYRDQAKNIDDCREKLRAIVLLALMPPKVRRPTRPSRGSKLRRLDAKRRQAQRKAGRRDPAAGE